MHVRRLRCVLTSCLPAPHYTHALASLLNPVHHPTPHTIADSPQVLAFVRQRCEMAVPSVARLPHYTADILAVLVRSTETILVPAVIYRRK